MKLRHDVGATAAGPPWFRSSVAALARRALTSMRVSLLPRPALAPRHTAALSFTARRSGAPPFADTEAGWHHL
jgi:hypothetical protein